MYAFLMHPSCLPHMWFRVVYVIPNQLKYKYLQWAPYLRAWEVLQKEASISQSANHLSWLLPHLERCLNCCGHVFILRNKKKIAQGFGDVLFLSLKPSRRAFNFSFYSILSLYFSILMKLTPKKSQHWTFWDSSCAHYLFSLRLMRRVVAVRIKKWVQLAWKKTTTFKHNLETCWVLAKL